MNLTALEEEIATLAVQLSAATYRLLDCIRRFDEAGGWATPGFVSCAQWLSWRIGLGLNAAREKLRVAHALVQLPKLAAAFQRGEVSYSKVRALTRIARPEIEETLLTIAEYGHPHDTRPPRQHPRRRAQDAGHHHGPAPRAP